MIQCGSLINYENEIIASQELHSLITRPEEDHNVTYSVLHSHPKCQR